MIFELNSRIPSLEIGLFPLPHMRIFYTMIIFLEFIISSAYLIIRREWTIDIFIFTPEASGLARSPNFHKTHQCCSHIHTSFSLLSRTRDARFGSKVGQIGPKWDKSGAFLDQISVHLAPPFQIRFQCGAKCT